MLIFHVSYKQLQTESELMQKRAEASEAELENERGLHRRELRRRAKELTDIQKELSQVCSQCHTGPELPRQT